MADEIQPRILLAALVQLLIEVLEREETAHLASDGLLSELRGLRARVEGELETRAGRRPLRLADEDEPEKAGGSAVADY